MRFDTYTHKDFREENKEHDYFQGLICASVMLAVIAVIATACYFGGQNYAG